MKKIFFLSLIITCTFLSCEKEAKDGTDAVYTAASTEHFELLSPSASGIKFKNQIKETKEFHHLLWESVFYGGGVAIGDLNNDNLPDLYFTGNQQSDALYINKGNLKFEDISKSAGIQTKGDWSTGVTMVDINGDGLLDIYVCKSWWDMDANNIDLRRNKLWINNGDMTFTDKAAEYGIDDPAHSTQATFFDYDKDGDLDMYLMNMPSNNFKQKIIYQQKNEIPYQFSDKLYENLGRGTFVDKTKKAGIENYAFGLGLIATDMNQDGWMDIYVACDYEQPDKLFINNKNGTFTDRASYEFKHTAYSSMGCDVADFNNDALADIAVLDMQAADHKRSKTNMRAMNAKNFWRNVAQGYGFQYMSNALQLNNGYGFFSEIGQMAGIAQTDWSWAVLMADFDNDQYKDIFITNGVNRDMRNSDLVEQMKNVSAAERAKTDLLKLAKSFPSEKLPNYLFQNQQNLTFNNVAKDWGLGQAGFSYGAAYGDLDADGDLDLVLCNNNDFAQVFRNNKKGNYLQIKLKGNKVNPLALGARAYLHYGEKKQYQELTLTRGYQSAVEPLLHFGLGDVSLLDSVLVVFPNSQIIKLTAVKANQRLELEQSEAKTDKIYFANESVAEFKDVTQAAGISFRHKENRFDDFSREILLPHMQSKNGPFIATGDVNGDRKTDFFVGGASGQSGVLFLQKSKGTFAAAANQPWDADQEKEDMGVLMADFDGDKDLDIYVVSGGGEHPEGADQNVDRIYINDGRGNFTKDAAFTGVNGNGSCIAAADVDADGDLDLFVGSRGLPGKYPRGGESYLLINNKGTFENQTASWSPNIKNMGMVTDATWEDFNNDGRPDLVVVGEWMSPTFYENTGNELKDVSAQVLQEDLTGWWFHLSAEDLDQDGDTDFVVGNIGLNNKFHPKPGKPLKVYAYDFDQNESNDIVLAKNTEYGEVPVRGRECSSEQMPFIATKFRDFNSFANATIGDIYGDNLKKATSIAAKEFRNGILRNDGTGNFTFEPFPNEAQLSPVQDCKMADLNGDGRPELLLAGNHYDAEVETVRYDAGNGAILMSDESGAYRAVPVGQSRFYVPFNTKDMALIPNYKGKRSLILTANNNFQIIAYEF